MTATDTPAERRPQYLDSAKKAAKALRRALAAGDAAARDRFRAVFGDRKGPDQAVHADCLHVIAREAGAESWPRLKLAVETAALSRADRITALERAIANGAFHRVDRLLALDPSLVDAHLGLQLAFARRDAVRAALDRDPSLAVTPIGRRWPLHHLCFSKLHQRDPGAVEAMVALLDALLSAGADINQGFPAELGSDHQLSALYGALGHAGNLALAQALLARGANPNDNESLYHATELETLDGVRLLFAHGAEIGRTNAFFRMLDRENPDGVRLFLANGADPNAPVYDHPTDRPKDRRNALHHAILRGRSGDIGTVLVDHGVDLAARFDGRTPYALAIACGNRSMAEMLAGRGADTALAPAETFLAAIAADDADRARTILAEHPEVWNALTPRDRQRQTDLAMAADSLPILRLMADLGFDPNHPGESDMPPIHAAAWWGHADTVAFYIGLGVDLERVNMFGGAALGTAIHGSTNCPGRETGDYLRCVQRLVEAGARIVPEAGHLEMGTEEVTAYLEDRLDA